ncbi:hypothetical protein TNCV_4881201 [Trichonephila clavipes]|nr:hypothetical protein TNCV_4881201 [Trichonephila clavipes]
MMRIGYINHPTQEIMHKKRVLRLIPHPNYNAVKITNDIALIELVNPIVCLDLPRPICLPTRNFSKLGNELIIAGWGVSEAEAIYVAFPARPRHALLAKDLVTWQAMVGRHILEDIVGRVAQYVDEHYPVDKWHLGDLIAWVVQSALKYRPRICELSKCLEGPLKMIVCPKKLLPTLSHLVKLLYAARQ